MLVVPKFTNVTSEIAFVQGRWWARRYIVGALDLQPVNHANLLVKYAGGVYLLVGSSQLVTVEAEFMHIKSWAKDNNLHLKASITREMQVLRQPLKGPTIHVLILGA